MKIATIIIPPPVSFQGQVTLENGTTENRQLQMSFRDFLTCNLLIDKRFGKSYSNLKILKKLHLCPVEGSWEVSETELNLLKEIIEFPEKPYAIEIGLIVLPFLDAIMQA